MIWATWRMHRSVLVVSLALAAAFAIWLAISGSIEAHAWAIFTGNHCSTNYPGRSQTCMSSLSGVGNFSSVNALLCAVLPAILGLVLGVPLVAGEFEQGTNRLAWTQSITRTRWLLTKIGVGALVTVGVVGAMAPQFWWWTDAAQRSSHIEPPNFDISGFVPVAYALFAFMLGVALGALIRRPGWAFATSVPLFALARLGVRQHLRAGLVSPTTVPTAAYAPVGSTDWYLNAGFLPLGRSTPASGQSWSSANPVIEQCQGLSGNHKPLHSATYCAKVHHLHYVVQLQPPSHFWALQAAESAIFVGLAVALLGLTVSAVRRWRT